MTDMLRASVVLSVSAFDYLVHEIFRVEAIRRLKAKRPVSRFTVPFNILNHDNADFEMHLDAHIREINSYKSFVDPKKFSEALGCFVADPWTKIATQIGSRPDELKTRIRAIYRWRNRIAHEADINPVLSGIGLWPIHKSDVVGAIEDIELVGVASVKLLRES
nr:HEPN domain-containing protein [Bosea psychrotolerans]